MCMRERESLSSLEIDEHFHCYHFAQRALRCGESADLGRASPSRDLGRPNKWTRRRTTTRTTTTTTTTATATRTTRRRRTIGLQMHMVRTGTTPLGSWSPGTPLVCVCVRKQDEISKALLRCWSFGGVSTSGNSPRLLKCALKLNSKCKNVFIYKQARVQWAATPPPMPPMPPLASRSIEPGAKLCVEWTQVCSSKSCTPYERMCRQSMARILEQGYVVCLCLFFSFLFKGLV